MSNSESATYFTVIEMYYEHQQIRAIEFGSFEKLVTVYSVDHMFEKAYDMSEVTNDDFQSLIKQGWDRINDCASWGVVYVIEGGILHK
jgi:hypothetical protein